MSDEALDLNDDSNREIVKSIFENELAGTAIISIGSNSHTNGFYARCIKLVPASTGDRGPEESGKPA